MQKTAIILWLILALLPTACANEKPTPELAAGAQELPSFEMTSAAFAPGDAIDIKLNLAPGATKSQVLDAIAGHVLAQAELMGTYTH